MYCLKSNNTHGFQVLGSSRKALNGPHFPFKQQFFPGLATHLAPNRLENFNYLNVAFISYKLTMWDLMLFSGCHTRGQRLRKKDRSC